MINIVLADDHKMFVAGIAGLLEEVPDFHVAAIFDSGTKLIQYLEVNKADVVLTDLNMPGMDGIEVLQSLKDKKIKTKVIVLSMYDDENIFQKCKTLGARAYMLKDADFDELKYTIREVVAKTHVMSFQKLLVQNQEDSYGDQYREKYKLSRREIQILKMVKDGMANRKIAANLHLSILTVETHRKSIYQKLNVGSIVELINKAREMNL